eukprot:m.268779 g.268779  ORF g.268779 m.268779 type:complete len:1976 (-) comp16059_c0_seq12:62-5989(-)
MVDRHVTASRGLTGWPSRALRLCLVVISGVAGQSPSVSPTSSPTLSPSTTAPTVSPSASPTRSPSLSPTTSNPTSSPTLSPSTTVPSASPTTSPSLSPTTSSPSSSPTGTPTASPMSVPTVSPTTTTPSASPTLSPSTAPSVSPSSAPTTTSPTASPSVSPTTTAPTASPTSGPTTSPTTHSPTTFPTLSPSSSPSISPTVAPTLSPTSAPTLTPSLSPTQSPSLSPSVSPTASPTMSPTASPSSSPTISPSTSPSSSPTTSSPTASPTPVCIHTGVPDNETLCRNADCSVFFQGIQCPGFCPQFCTAVPTQAPTVSPTLVGALVNITVTFPSITLLSIQGTTFVENATAALIFRVGSPIDQSHIHSVVANDGSVLLSVAFLAQTLGVVTAQQVAAGITGTNPLTVLTDGVVRQGTSATVTISSPEPTIAPTGAPTAIPTSLPTPSCGTRIAGAGSDPSSCASTMITFGFPQSGAYFDCSAFLQVATVCPAHCNTCTHFPTHAPTTVPTVNPTKSPTTSPTISPTVSPTLSPSTSSPTLGPSVSPTTSPTFNPSVSPTDSPTLSPSTSPTLGPTVSPSVSPSTAPSLSPTFSPSTAPTVSPTENPSVSPTISPTTSPTSSPTLSPTVSPTVSPTLSPSLSPTFSPSTTPTTSPTQSPSMSPTVSPTSSPTVCTIGQFINATTRVCEICNQPGTWMNESAHTLEECIPWSTCSSGQFEASPGSHVLDRVCESCPANTFRSESNHVFTFCEPFTRCSEGFVRVSGTGDSVSDISCATCQPGTFMNFSSHLNTTCFDCAEGTFTDVQASSNCTAHKICTPPSEVLSINGTTTSDAVCKVCNLLGQFSVNGDCFPCEAGTFQDQIAQSSCRNMTVCSAGTFSVYDNVASTQTIDRQCSACPANTFQATETTSTTCSPHSQCLPGTYETGAGTPTTDTACTTWSLCNEGEYADDVANPPWYNQDRTCLPCNSSNFVSAEMITTAGFTVASGHSLGACQNWAEGCATNFRYIEGSESPTTDRVCEVCPTGTEIALSGLHLNTTCTDIVAQAATASPPVGTGLAIGIAFILLVLVIAFIVAWRISRAKNEPEDMAKIQDQLRQELGMAAVMSFGEECLGVSIELEGNVDALVLESLDLPKMVQHHLAVLILGLPGKPLLDEVQFDATTNSALVVLSPPNKQTPLAADKVVSTLDKALRKKHVVIHAGGEGGEGPITAVGAAQALPRRVSREISTKKLLRLEKLGEGNFAEVFRAQLDESDRHLPPYPVAAKVLKGGLDAEVRKSFLREAALMAMLDHPNIVQLVGVCTVPRDLPPLLLMQFCDRGSLELYLQEHSREVELGNADALNDTVKLTFAGDICRGLQYLATCRIVHRDVAARNVLLDAAYICRIGDFGLSQALSDDKEYVRMYEQVAVRWAAREVLEEDKFSSASDIWSFGVVLHEIMSMGEHPYKDLQTNTMVIDFITTGGLMGRHVLCPPTVYNQLILPCWHDDPAERIDYNELLELIEALGGSESSSADEGMAEFRSETGDVTLVKNLTVDDMKLQAPSVWHLNLHLRAKVEEVIQEGLRREPPPPRWPPSLAETEVAHMTNLYTKPHSADTICPRDMQLGAAYVDMLKGPENVGKASALLSYSWGNRVFDIFDALVQWCRAHKRTERHTYIWICDLCLNQHRKHKIQTAEELSAEFGPRVCAIGRIIPFMDPWYAPEYIKRAWCIMELFTAISLGHNHCKIDITLSPQEEKRFKEAIVADGYGKFDAILGELKSENAQATFKPDLDAIFKLIEAVPGKFEKIDATIKSHLREWATVMGGAMRSNARSDFGIRGKLSSKPTTSGDSSLYTLGTSGFPTVPAIHGEAPQRMGFYRRVNGSISPEAGSAPRFPLALHHIPDYAEYLVPPIDDEHLVPEIPQFRGHMHKVMQRLKKNKSAIQRLRQATGATQDDFAVQRSSTPSWISPARSSASHPPRPPQLPPIRRPSRGSLTFA